MTLKVKRKRNYHQQIEKQLKDSLCSFWTWVQGNWLLRPSVRKELAKSFVQGKFDVLCQNSECIGP